jgi:hypothetical protein
MTVIAGLSLQAIKQKTFRPQHYVWIAACIGFMILVLLQGKFFLYHSIPFLGAAFLCLGTFEKIPMRHVLLTFFLITTFNLSQGFLVDYFRWQFFSDQLGETLKNETSVRQMMVLSPRYALLPVSLLEKDSLVYSHRYQLLWFGPWMLDLNENPKKQTPRNLAYQAYFLKAMGEDIRHYQPQIIILDRNQDESVLRELMKNPDFRAEWENFAPLPVNLGLLSNMFQVFIRKDFPEPEGVRQAIEDAVKASSLNATPAASE